ARAVEDFAPGGFDVIVDTTGSAAALNQEIGYLRKHGRFVFQGWYPGETDMNMHLFTSKYARAFFPCAMRGGDVARAMELTRDGKLRVRPLIGDPLAPEQVPDMYQHLLADASASVGRVIRWSE